MNQNPWWHREVSPCHPNDMAKIGPENGMLQRATKPRLVNEELWTSLEVLKDPKGLSPFLDHVIVQISRAQRSQGFPWILIPFW